MNSPSRGIRASQRTRNTKPEVPPTPGEGEGGGKGLAGRGRSLQDI